MLCRETDSSSNSSIDFSIKSTPLIYMCCEVTNVARKRKTDIQPIPGPRRTNERKGPKDIIRIISSKLIKYTKVWKCLYFAIELNSNLPSTSTILQEMGEMVFILFQT